jgi:N-acetyl-anhydromuramyl-L-alanine amidase AmpD
MKITDISKTLPTNSRNNKWGRRPKDMINKIIVHQELSDGDTFAVNNYHISKECHLKPGFGAPKISYHFTIEKDGKIYKCNEYTDCLWAVKGQNLKGIMIMLCGNFDGPSWKGTSEGPTNIQMSALEWLLGFLISDIPQLKKKDVFGHSDFGKENCPGTKTQEFIEKYRKS